MIEYKIQKMVDSGFQINCPICLETSRFTKITRQSHSSWMLVSKVYYQFVLRALTSCFRGLILPVSSSSPLTTSFSLLTSSLSPLTSFRTVGSTGGLKHTTNTYNQFSHSPSRGVGEVREGELVRRCSNKMNQF